MTCRTVDVPGFNNVRHVFDLVVSQVQMYCEYDRRTAVVTPLQGIGEVRDMVTPQSDDHFPVLGAY